MNVCFIVDRPHPVLFAVKDRLTRTHSVTFAPCHEQPPPADCYLLKSHSTRGLAAARSVERRRGAIVINNSEATAACLDRVMLSEKLLAADLPLPETRAFSSIQTLAADASAVESFTFPVMIKSRYSRRGDLVARADSADDVRGLARRWGAEPVVAQRFIRGDGWDTKLWVIGDEKFAARRRSPLDSGSKQRDLPVSTRLLPTPIVDVTDRVGACVGLQLHGVDLVLTRDEPVVVDVNPFPGYRGARGGVSALARFIDQQASNARAAA
jgi:ribosomal protein S6--L-glutamate ligase